MMSPSSFWNGEFVDSSVLTLGAADVQIVNPRRISVIVAGILKRLADVLYAAWLSIWSI
jgi:hypothetical protein